MWLTVFGWAEVDLGSCVTVCSEGDEVEDDGDSDCKFEDYVLLSVKSMLTGFSVGSLVAFYVIEVIECFLR